jgi:hypothetical protein
MRNLNKFLYKLKKKAYFNELVYVGAVAIAYYFTRNTDIAAIGLILLAYKKVL